MTLPDGALQFMELDSQTVVGVFRCNSCGWSADKFLPWRLKRSVKELKGSLLRTLSQFETSVSEETRRRHGQALYLALFDSENATDIKAAREAFVEFVRTRSARTMTGDVPSLFVRLLASSSDSVFTIPIGLLTLPDPPQGLPEKPIGLQFRVETPLHYQDYTPAATCLSRWAGLVPDPTKFDPNDQMHEVGAPLARWVSKFTPPGRKPEMFSSIDAFRKWLSDDKSPVSTEGVAVLVASHHDGNSLYFDDTDRLESEFVQRKLHTPSMVIMNACGTGRPGDSDFLRRFNEQGASAAIATSTTVNPKMAGDFVSTFLGLVATHKDWPIGRAFFETVSVTSRQYKTQVLSYMLLGNAGLKVCVP